MERMNLKGKAGAFRGVRAAGGRSVKIMGILNVTPDSFSDGGKFFSAAAAAARAAEMLEQGADIIDVGGESTGPGSRDVGLQEELRRVIPALESLRALAGRQVLPGRAGPSSPGPAWSGPASPNEAVISIDTYKAEVARRAIALGAAIVNDVTALRGDPEMGRVIAETGVSVVLMYSKDATARTTRRKKKYRDVVKTILDFLEERIAFAARASIRRAQIIIDPGMGAFVSGDPRYSFEILRRLPEFKKLGLPILVGASRKSFIPGRTDERLPGTLLAHALAVQNGASIIRVHDVAEHQNIL